MEDDQKIERFCKWLHDQGCRYPKIAWPSNDTVSGIRGAVALEDIATDEVMMEIPVKLLMCEPKALADPDIGKVLKENVDTIDGDMILTVFMMSELRKGERSFWFPFLEILPDPGTISEWSDDQLDLLQDDNMVLKAKQKRILLVDMYNKSVGALCEKYPETFNTEDFSLERFKFCWHSILARAFGKRLPWSAMVPFADCLNHSNVQTKYDYNVNGNELFRMFPTGANNYPRGTEVFNSYGRRKNDNLLLEYGFALLDNEWESVQTRLSLPRTIDNFESKQRALFKVGLSAWSLVGFKRAMVPLEALTYLRILSLSSEEFDSLDLPGCWSPFCDGYAVTLPGRDLNGEMTCCHAGPGGRFRHPVSVPSELQAVHLLQACLHDMMQGWPTTVSQDIELLQRIEQTPHRSEEGDRELIAVVYRLTRKRIIDDNLKLLQLEENFLQGVIASSTLEEVRSLMAPLLDYFHVYWEDIPHPACNSEEEVRKRLATATSTMPVASRKSFGMIMDYLGSIVRIAQVRITSMSSCNV